MTLAGDLDFASGGGRAYPARHVVVDAELVRDGLRIPVVVKKTPIGWRQRLGETKAERSFRTARALLALGLPTPEPLGFRRMRQESWYVARRIESAVQIRAWFLHRDDPSTAPPPLALPFDEVVRGLGRLARALHDHGVFFRDLSDGNVLVSEESGACRLWLVDLNRARMRRPGGLLWRLRDLARPGLNRPEDRALLLSSYFAPDPTPARAARLLAFLRARLVLWDELKRRARPWKGRGVSSGLQTG